MRLTPAIPKIDHTLGELHKAIDLYRKSVTIGADVSLQIDGFG
jgi:hypothetical protein